MADYADSQPAVGSEGNEVQVLQSVTRGRSRKDFLRILAAFGMGTLASGKLLLAQASRPSTKSGLIDLHHHILPPVYLAEARDRLVAKQQGYLPARVLSWSPQTTIAEIDQNGVATSIVSILTPGIWCGNSQSARTPARRCNEYAAQLVKDYPGRFGFFAAAPLPDTEGSLQEIAYALDVLKADGIGLLTSYGDKWLGDSAYAAVFEELNRRKAVVYFHPTGPNCCRDLIPHVPCVITELPHDTTRAITSLLFAGCFTRFRDIRFIFSHAGGTLPMLADRISRYSVQVKELADRLPNGVEYELKEGRKFQHNIPGPIDSEDISWRSDRAVRNPAHLHQTGQAQKDECQEDPQSGVHQDHRTIARNRRHRSVLQRLGDETGEQRTKRRRQ